MTGAATHGIVPALASMATPIDLLTVHPRNPNLGDTGAIAQQMSAQGQTKPIVAQRSTGHVLAGNHRLMAAQLLGWTHMAVAWADVDDTAALRLLVGDNLPARGARDDDDQLVRVLGMIAAEGRLEATGYDGADLAALLERIGEPDLPAAVEAAEENATPREHEFWPTLRIEVDADTADSWARLVAAAAADPADVLADLIAGALA